MQICPGPGTGPAYAGSDERPASAGWTRVAIYSADMLRPPLSFSCSEAVISYGNFCREFIDN